MGLARKINRAVAAAAVLTTGAAGVCSVAHAAVAGTAHYTVVAADGVPVSTAAAAVRRLGGRVLSSNDAVGMLSVEGPGAGFVEAAAASPALVGAALEMPIGHAPARPAVVASERPTPGGATGSDGPDPLDGRLWGMRMVHADRARAVEPGDKRVTVGVLDTGIDASHPDIAPNFNWALSRNFAPDKAEVDGPCEVASCLDPVGTDDGGHGTHVAGIIGASANGVGVTGVAPGVSLVELKGGQDSGLFFLEPVVNALTYAADAGIDVVNMSFFVDPWIYNCTANPADSPADQAQQRTIIKAMFCALTYAHTKGTTLVSALGNDHEDKDRPRPDTGSPDYPPATTHTRPIDPHTCWNLPVEGPFVIGVSAVGPSGSKADYSDYGRDWISVAGPGGYLGDFVGTPRFRRVDNEILSTVPKKIMQDLGEVDADGNIVAGFENSVFKQCVDGACGYYTYLEGSSMASPYAAGVAALIVSRFGHPDPLHHGALTLEPWKTEAILDGTAAAHACPSPRTVSYVAEGDPAEYTATCEGPAAFNSFYGFGVIDAYAAVTFHPRF